MKKPMIFRVSEVAIPENKVMLFFTDRKDFLKWVVGGGCYATNKPDKEGFYTFYAFDDTNLAIIFKQKGDKL